jgi:outer membrane protein assembly factor BamA
MLRIAMTFGLSAFVAIQTIAQSKLVEDVEIRGYRTVSVEEIKKRLHTEPGKPFSAKRSTRDFERLMKMGVFDKLKSKLVIEDGPRGGKIVIFVLEEIPKDK